MDATATFHPQPSDARDGDGRLTLIVLGCTHAPSRIGEVWFLPTAGQAPAVLGRDGDVRWSRQRPGRLEPIGPIDDPFLSRRQLVLSPDGRELFAENVGRLPLTLNGRPVTRCPLREGDVLQVGQQLLLLVTRRPRVLPGEIERGHSFAGPDAVGWVGESPLAWRLREQVRFMARRDQHVLVLGESGTGKELVAKALHVYSPRAKKPLVSRNAATIPESLADAELFGNLAGYPNIGTPARAGMVGEADGGMLFLDEFGELPLEQQARLLRVLDSGEYTRLGDAKPRTSDLRLIAATNRDPSALKHDVLARFPLRLQVPALHARVEDIPLLAMHMLRQLGREDREIGERFCDESGTPRVTLDLLRYLVEHRYTTHVRELRAILWRAITHAGDRDVLGVPPPEPAGAGSGSPPPVHEGVDPATLDPATIQAALDRHDGRQEPAWRELGLASRHVLTRLVRKHGLSVRGRS
jgi:DNA-binding NtrC family response regulator